MSHTHVYIYIYICNCFTDWNPMFTMKPNNWAITVERVKSCNWDTILQLRC